jgi:hypothetical protein
MASFLNLWAGRYVSCLRRQLKNIGIFGNYEQTQHHVWEVGRGYFIDIVMFYPTFTSAGMHLRPLDAGLICT